MYGIHAHTVADFRRRFWASPALTLPILALSSDFWTLLGLSQPLSFSGDHYVLFTCIKKAGHPNKNLRRLKG